MTKIAVLLTCFNRKDKTTSCLRHLFAAKEKYASDTGQQLELAIYLTDDGCTDGTAEAAKEVCKGQELHIVKGTGSLYWAGGMRWAWKEAQKDNRKWDFYLLLNDDTIIYDNVFEELMSTHVFAISQFGNGGIYSGITCEIGKPEVITYGGDVYDTPAMGSYHRLRPNGTPQRADQTNANILLVANNVVDSIGTFSNEYIHSAADLDYSLAANKANLPVLVTPHVCGECSFDHTPESEICKRLIKMSLSQRRKYVYAPTHSDKDYLTLIKRQMPQKYLMSWTLRKLRLYTPSIYYKINKMRGIY